MNLQECLNYRSGCLIHNKTMEPYSCSDENRNIRLTEKGLELHHRTSLGPIIYSKYLLHYDGTISSKVNIYSLFDNPPLILMQCEECAKIPMSSNKNLGVTTLNDVKFSVHRYTFNLSINNDIYNCHLGEEIIRYRTNEKFYHVSANLSTGSAQFKMGKHSSDELVEQLLSSLMCLNVPKFEPRRITSTDQLVEKIKIYNLFS